MIIIVLCTHPDNIYNHSFTPSSFQISMNVIRQCLAIAAYSFVKIPLGVLTARALRDSS